MEKFRGLRMACILLVVLAARAIPSPAQTLTVLHSFHGPDGRNPSGGLVQATDGNLYGTIPVGGAHNNCADGCGTVFRISPAGMLTTIYNFCAQTDCTDGWQPSAGLIQGPDGNLYGTTGYYGTGNSYNGTIFKITLQGKLTTLYSFCAETGCPDGQLPEAPLVQGTDGNFYGTTLQGGTGTKCIEGCGTVFKITPSGALTTLHNFDGVDGSGPGGLIQATDGNFYGTTEFGGSSTNCTNRCGTIFRITPEGTFQVGHSFDSTDGALPEGIIQGADGNFYGTTEFGGTGSCNFGCGTVFKITPARTLTTVHNFDVTDGEDPLAGLVQATDGNLYGTTFLGGANDGGTVFSITATGTLTTLYSFCAETGCPDGEEPEAPLLQATNGNFYGTTIAGGTNLDGTVFELSVGLGPFVETLPTSGAVGTPVIILGSNLTGATRVGFNGTPATFTVVSSSEITTTLPAGANSGSVTVLTPSGLLKSNVMFRVTP